VEMTCDSVIIINRGRVAASDSLADLARKAGEKASLVAVFDNAVLPEECRHLPGVISVTVDGASRLRIAAEDMNVLAPQLAALATTRGWNIRELRPEKPTLEDLFVEITGHTD
jgi:ABC-2 type transport system ATP-binding protein